MRRSRTGARPTSSTSRPTSRRRTRTVRRAECRPAVATTVKIPERSATKRPSLVTMAAAPAARISGAVWPATANSTGTLRTGRPRASRATAVKTTTSPVRTVSSVACSAREATGFASTSMVTVSVTCPAAADSAADPGWCSSSEPYGSISATAGLALANSMSTSCRTTPLVSTTSTPSRGWVPA